MAALAGQRPTTAFVVDVEPQSLPLIYLLGIPESPVTIARLRNTEGGELFVEGFRERHAMVVSTRAIVSRVQKCPDWEIFSF